MSKYYLLMFLVMGIALYYAFIRDPCNRQVRTDFSSKHPSYEIVDSRPSEGSPESVRCNISYREPDSDQVYRDTWLYIFSKKGWEFSKVLEARMEEKAL